MWIGIMFDIDGVLLLAIAGLVLVLAQRDYCNAGMKLRAALYAISFFAFCCSVDAFGFARKSWEVAYWAPICFHAFLLLAVVNRVITGHFLPVKPNRRFMRGVSAWF